MPDILIETGGQETNTTLVLRKNPAHNVAGHIERAKYSLAALATVYLVTEAAGQPQATLDAKRRDLQRFLLFYQDFYWHDRPDEWYVALTKASKVRIDATVRHFARWLHRKFPGLFPLGCPTEGVKPPAEPTPDWKGLTRREAMRLDAAALTLRAPWARHQPGPAEPTRCLPCYSTPACASPKP